MVSQDTAKNAVGIIGTVISVCLFLSPMPTFYKIWKKGSVEQYSATPYLASLVNCMVWVLYGLPVVHPHSTLVITTNGIGTGIEIFYIVLFLIYTQKYKQRLRVLGVVTVEFVFVALLTFMVLHFAHTTNKRTTVVGIVATCFNIFMYASPLTVMKLVITTKSVEYMPFSLSFTSMLSGIFWSAYGLIRYDLYIILPNRIGSLFSLTQLLLYASYYKNTQKILAERKVKAQVSLSRLRWLQTTPRLELMSFFTTVFIKMVPFTENQAPSGFWNRPRLAI